MPVYAFKCSGCGETADVKLAITDDIATNTPECPFQFSQRDDTVNKVVHEMKRDYKIGGIQIKW